MMVPCRNLRNTWPINCPGPYLDGKASLLLYVSTPVPARSAQSAGARILWRIHKPSAAASLAQSSSVKQVWRSVGGTQSSSSVRGMRWWSQFASSEAGCLFLPQLQRRGKFVSALGFQSGFPAFWGVIPPLLLSGVLPFKGKMRQDAALAGHFHLL